MSGVKMLGIFRKKHIGYKLNKIIYFDHRSNRFALNSFLWTRIISIENVQKSLFLQD